MKAPIPPAPISVPGLPEVLANSALLEHLSLDAVLDVRRKIAHLAADLDAVIFRRMARGVAHHGDTTTDDTYLTMAEVVKRTGLSASHLYELARAGDLPVRRMGKRGSLRGCRLLLSDLKVWEESKRQAPPEYG